MKIAIKYFALGLALSILSGGFAAETVKDLPPALNKKLEAEIQASSIAAQGWLEIADKGQYERSWEASSDLTHSRISKKDWVKILEKTRKPHGSVNNRSILDIRTAKNPRGLPEGDYMVYFYNTSFAKKPLAYELLTLFFENGQWKVVTYQVD